QPSPPIRVMASADGTTMVAVYHLNLSDKPSHVGDKQLLFCDVTTEYSDGTFLVTSNTEGLDLMTPPPMLNKRAHALETPALELVRMHKAEKSKLLAAKEGASYVIIRSLDDALESERRQQAVKNAFRK